MLLTTLTPVSEEDNILISFLDFMIPNRILDFASAQYISFIIEPASTVGSPLGNSVGVNFRGGHGDGSVGTIRVRLGSSGGSAVCTGAKLTFSWSCLGSPDWTTPSSGSGSQVFYAGDGTYGSTKTVYWAEPPNAAPTFTTPSGTTQEYTDSGTFSINWNSADVDGNLDNVYVDDLDGGYVYSTSSDYYDEAISGSSDTFTTTWNKNAFLGTKTYTGRVYDTDSLYATTSGVSVTIQDTTNPVITSTPSNSNCEYATSGTCSIGNWAATDFLANQYRIQRKLGVGGSYADVRSLTTWVSGNSYTFDHPKNLGLGNVYYYKTEFVDTSSNNVWSSETTVTMVDTTDPTQTAAPSSQNVEYATSGSTTLSFWTGNDWLPSEYRVMRDYNSGGYAAVTGWLSWTSTSQQVTYDHSNSLALGSYKYRIEWKDTSGNTYTSTALEITVTHQDTTNPVVTVNQADISVEYASSGTTTLSWTATDYFASDYQIERQFNSGGYSTIVAYGNGWTTGVATTYAHARNLAIGTYDYRITFKDTSGNTIQDIATITQEDTTDPVVTSYPSNTNVEWASSGTYSVASWSATDLLASQYRIMVKDPDDPSYVEGRTWTTWVSGNTYDIDLSKNGLLGAWNYYAEFKDTTGSTVSSAVTTITLQDTINPVVTVAQSDINVEYTASGATQLSWTATDLLADDYQIERQFNSGGYSTIVAYGNGWTSGVATTYDHAKNLALGSYDYRVTFKDTTGNTIQDIATITQEDTANPVVTIAQSDIDVEYVPSGTTQLSWTATDFLADDYQIERQFNSGGYSTIVAYGNGWTSGVATTYDHPNNLALGTYDYRITFKDTTGNTIQDIATITQEDTTIPAISETPTPFSVEYAPTGSSVVGNWNGTDYLTDDYKIEVDYNGGGYSIVQDWTSWTSGNQYSTNHAHNNAIGTYTYRVTFRDTSGNTNSSTVVVTHEDTTYPQISEYPSGANIEYSLSGSYTLAYWNGTDLLADEYRIMRRIDGGAYAEVRTWTSWTSGVQYSFAHDNNLALGTYDYIAEFTDTSGLSTNSSLTTIIQEDTTNPVSNTIPDDMNVEYAASGTSTFGNWNGTDLLADDYRIERQYNSGGYSDIVAWTSWTSGNNITYEHANNLALGTYEYRIIYRDTSGNLLTSSVTTITHEDTTDPVIITIPSGTDNEYSDTGTFTIGNWNGTDLLNDSYVIWQNYAGGSFSIIDSGSWNSGENITYAHSNSLALGSYGYYIVFNDTSNNSIQSSTIYLNQVDTTDPTFTLTQNDINVEYSDTGTTQLSWTGTDLLAQDYQLERQLDGGGYSVIISWTSWTSGVATTYDHDDTLPLGIYDYRITYRDTTGNTIQDIATVTQEDTTNPVSNTIPDDMNVEYAASGTSTFGNWNGTDLLADDYRIERQYNSGGWSDVVTWTSWTSGAFISYEHSDNLALGSYEYRIIYRDTSGNTITSSITTVTQEDTTDPISTETPVNYTTEYATSGTYSLEYWSGTDLLADEYKIERQFSGGGWSVVRSYSVWVSGNQYSIDFDLSEIIGTYEYRVTYKDTSGNTVVSAIITITHQDTTDPTVDSPGDQTYESGDTDAKSITWNLGDNYDGKDYDIYRSTDNSTWGSPVQSGTWSGLSDSAILNGVGGQTISYYYKIEVFDSSDNMVLDIVFVEITSITNPIISHPADTSYEIGNSSTHNIIWSLSDEYEGLSWQIQRSIDNSTWGSILFSNSTSNDNAVFTYDVSGETLDYYYNVTLTDNAGHSSYDVVFVGTYAQITIQEFSRSSYIDGDGNYVTYEDALFVWSAYDNTATTDYDVYRNDSLIIEDKSWVNETITYDEFNDDGTLGSGIYNLTLVVNSTNGVTGVLEVLVDYSDTIPNIFSTPSIQTFSYGESNLLQWGVVDKYPTNYSIYKNDSIIQSGSWSLSEYISIPLQSLAVDTYNYTLRVFDKIGNSNTDTQIIEITSNPTFSTKPSDLSYAFASTSNSLAWVVDNVVGGSFELFVDTVSIDSGSWNPDVSISFDIDGLATDLYNYTLVITDDNGQSISNIVWVQVTDEDGSPTIVIAPDDISYSVGSVGNEINWYAVDNFPTTYSIELNESEVQSGVWSSSEYVTIDIDGNLPGVYSYILYVYDSAGNLSSDEVVVTVT